MAFPQEADMPAYVSLVNFTEQGMHTIKDTVQRAQMIKEAAKAAGGRVIGIWWLMGQYDAMLISEAPDDETAMRQLVAAGMQGNTRSVTLRAFSEDEMTRIVGGLP
jgi:uncharacterized protein with GYD domain